MVYRVGRPLLAFALALLASVALLPDRARAGEVVVDDADSAVQVQGEWTRSELTPGFWGDTYLFRVPGDGTASVAWPFPAGAAAGRYEVFARWSGGANRATHAPYRVAHAGGSSEITLNQQVGGGVWQSLGTFEFQPGAGHAVVLSDRADGVVVADAVRWVGPLDTAPPPAAAAAPAPAPVALAFAPPGENAIWTVNYELAPVHAGPDEASHSFGLLPQFTFLQVLGYEGDWAHVYDPRARGTGYVRSEQLGPSDPPPDYVTAPPPPPLEAVNRAGRTVGSAPLAYYPVKDNWVYEERLGHNAPVFVAETVRGADGQVWYRTAEGKYLPEDAVRFPSPPPRTFPGRWIDVDLNEPAMLTAYEDDRPVLSTLVIKGVGRWQTPTGVFAIQRRVANETMDSATIGIPRDAPGGYHLRDVLFTQYFLGSGESLHYNYWSSNFGYAGSHGCVGLTYADAQWLWDWATLGTPISIHY